MLFKAMAKCMAMLVLALCVNVAFANEGGGHGGGEGGGAADSIPMEPVTVNLSQDHYIQFKPLLKLVGAEKAEEVRAWMPLVRHELIKFMIGRDAGEAGSPKFMSDFSKLAADVLNKALHDELVKEVMFDSWLVQ